MANLYIKMVIQMFNKKSISIVGIISIIALTVLFIVMRNAPSELSDLIDFASRTNHVNNVQETVITSYYKQEFDNEPTVYTIVGYNIVNGEKQFFFSHTGTGNSSMEASYSTEGIPIGINLEDLQQYEQNLIWTNTKLWSGITVLSYLVFVGTGSFVIVGYIKYKKRTL